MGSEQSAGAPRVAWTPDAERIARSNLGWLMRQRGIDSYAALHRWTIGERAAFWDLALRRLGVVLREPPRTVLDLASGAQAARWLPGARMNVVDSCFRAPAEFPAVIGRREGGAALTVTTFGQLARATARVAAGLRSRGLAPGDAVALYMPMTVECVAAYLGVVRAGCRVVSVADSFPAPELRRRVEIGGARAIVTVDRFTRAGRTIDLLDTVREADAPPAIVIPAGEGAPRLRAGDASWQSFLEAGQDDAVTACDPDEVTNVLFSSGTTGTPKAIPWTHLTPLKCAVDGHFHQDIRPADVVAWPTNVGWMMGPWLIYASLINRATIALFEGAPTGEEFLRFVRDARVTMLGVVPSLVRAWRRSGVARGIAWADLRVFSSTGEPSNVDDYSWLMGLAGGRAPVIEYCGGTEIGGGYLTGTVVQPAAPATFTTPALGLDLLLLGEDGRPVADGQAGEAFLVPPSIGLSGTLLNGDHDAIYHDGAPSGPSGEALRRHGDVLVRLPGGFWRAQGRADDTMNLAGIKVASLEIERVVDGHPAVAESAAVAVQAAGGGADRLVVFAVLAADGEPDGLQAAVARKLAAELNPLFRIHDLVVVDRLPRTASNKLMRRELRARYGEARES